MTPDPRTKIVCTLGPACDDRAILQAMIDSGMDMARLNCSHGDWDGKAKWIGWLREMAPHVSILADLQGPKFRIGEIPGGSMEIVAEEKVTLGAGDAQIPIHQKEILDEMEPGGRLLLGDGEIELAIESETGDNRFEARAVTGGCVKSRKGVTLVDRVFSSPSLTHKDVEDILEAVKNGVDFIALSYVKNAADLRELRRTVDRISEGPGIRLCAKIETREAIDDLPNILKVTDLVMVARGDLGLQMDIEQVPMMQKQIIEACTWAGVPVITATQMLESMIENARPTRAEATDVANAVLDGTDALMLSGETAAGKYPVECVRTMARIAAVAEARFDRTRMEAAWRARIKEKAPDHTDAIAHAVGSLAAQLSPA
ncbi:pyruvate kinase, partial [bacterium]